MKVSFIIFAAISFALVSTISGFAQVSKFAPENRVADPVGGYSFGIPNGWTKKDGEGGFVLVNAGQTVIVAIKAHDYRDFKSFMADANLERDALKQIGETKELGENTKYFRTARKTGQGILVIDTVVLFSPYGGGIAVAALSEQKDAEAGAQAAAEIAGTIVFVKPQQSSANGEWQTFLSGKQLIYLYTGNGYSERRDIWLCSSGGFFISFNGSSLSSIGSGAIGSNNRGKWRVSTAGGARLVLQFQNGETSQYNLRRRESKGEISLNNNRYFVKSHEECR